MSTLLRAERGRILSNYARLFAGLLIGLLVTRLLLEAGQELFGIYVTITVGMGVSIMLTELIRMALVPVLGVHVSQGIVIEIHKFRDDLTAAFFIAFVTSIIGGGAMILLGCWLLNDIGSPELEGAAWVFLALRVLMMIVIVSMTPVMVVLMVSSRQVQFNIFLFLERLCEFLGIALPLWLITGEDYNEADRLVQFGIGITVLSVVTYAAAGVIAFNPGSHFRPRWGGAKSSTICKILKRLGWSSLQTISMNLYVRLDIMIVAVFLGPVGAVALGVAIRLMGYVRQATSGLVNGLDATIANLRRQKNVGSLKFSEGGGNTLKLLSVSSALQASVVFHLSVLLLLSKEEIISLWLGDLIMKSGSDSSITEIAKLSTLMIIGIGLRSLNLAWMCAMTGNGNAHHFTPWLLPGALGNMIVLLIMANYFPSSFTVITVGWVFLIFQAVTHVLIIPVVSARSFGCSLIKLLSPIFIPFFIAFLTCIIALIWKLFFIDGMESLRNVGLVVLVAVGFFFSVIFSLRKAG